MLFQIIDVNYIYDDQGWPVVQLFGSTSLGKSVTCRVTGFRPYFYAGVNQDCIEKVQDVLSSMNLTTERVERFEPIGYQARPAVMLRIATKDPKSVRDLRERVREIPGVKAVYETDILFKNRYLIDAGLGGMGWAEVPVPDEAFGDVPLSVAAFEADLKSVQPADIETNAPLRYLAFDIECLPKNGEMPRSEVSPVILISLTFEPAFKGLKDLVLVGQDLECQRDDVVSCADEAALLTRFISILREYDPDIIAGYNSNEFDIPYLDERARRLRIDARLGRDGSSWMIRKIVSQTSVSITGRIVVDLLPIIRSSYSLKQYTLRNAAQELLGQEKHDVDPMEMEALWESGGEPLRRFISYSRRDAVLAMELLTHLRLMDKYIALSRASGSLLQDVVNGGQSGMVESLLLRRYREKSRVVPPKPDSEVSDERYSESDELKGGAVLVPEKGLVEDVVILDYKSLYPTIMMAHNLCYSTVVTVRTPAIQDVIRAPSGGEFVPPAVQPGIVPGVLKELLDERTATKRLMKSAGEEERRFLDAKQYAMKILLNSFYGYSGYARARLYSLSLANAVTSFGRENIVNTKRLIDSLGSIYIAGDCALLPQDAGFGKPPAGSTRYDLSVVYGDTDSVFVRIRPSELPLDGKVSGDAAPELSLDDAELIGKKIAETVTSNLPEPMELVYEAFARRAVFLTKKRYALWVFEKSGDTWKDRIKVRGMETIRRDWCELTSKTLKRCLDLLLKEGRVDDAVDYVRGVISKLQCMDIRTDRDLLDDLTLTRRYTKNPSSYKSKQPHIQLVEKMQRRGGRVPGIGDRVPFVIIKGNRKTLFVDKAEDPEYAVMKNLAIDTEYYIEKQLLPPVLRIFSSFEIDREKLLGGRRQRNLLDFHAESKPQKQKSLFDF